MREISCSAVALVLLGLAGGGCTCGGAPEEVIDACTAKIALPPSISTDILFVVDNSISMAEEQAKVVLQLNEFITTLATAEVKNDFQVGVVTTSISQHASTNCDGTDPFLLQFSAEAGRLQLGKQLDGTPEPASTVKILRFDEQTLLDEFRLLIGQGVRGSGEEMPLEAMRRALSEPLVSTALDAEPPGNAGFLRPGSRLLVVIVSDEDDCSDPTGTALVLLGASGCNGPCTSDADCASPGIYCVLPTNGTGARSCLENACETPEGRAKLAPVQEYVDFLNGLDDGTGSGRLRDVSLAILGPVSRTVLDNEGRPVAERCSGSSTEAYGTGQRHVEAVTGMAERGLIASICEDEYGPALQKIAELVAAPQTLDLPQPPPDGHLVLVKVTRADGSTEDCTFGDGFDFEAASGSAPARITMQGHCRLRRGDQIDLKLACAG